MPEREEFSRELIEETADRICELIQNYDFSSFLIGIRLPNGFPRDEARKEKEKKDLARRIGRVVSERLGKDVDFNLPDITVIVDFNKKPPRLELEIRSLFIYGEYQKLERDIPQTKWLCPKCRGRGCRYCSFTGKLYPTSVEEEIGKPLLEMTGGSGTKFHGAGREDRDALMLGWRPFVIEVLRPVVRRIDLRSLEEKINRVSDKVRVRNLRFSSKEEVRFLKEAKFDKTYEVLIECDCDVAERVSKLEKEFKDREIMQRTPTRVVHRRADKTRRRVVRYVKCESLGPNRFRAIIRTESGTYVKELVSGDDGRTRPSFSEVLGCKCRVVELNVLEVHMGDTD